MSVFARTVVLVPAFNNSSGFEDSVVRKLAGVPLVQRVIDKAQYFGVPKHNIHLLTNTEEIALFSKRNNVGVYLEQALSWEHAYASKDLVRYIFRAEGDNAVTLLLSPYAPLLTHRTVSSAVDAFLSNDHQVLKPARVEKRTLFGKNAHTLKESIFRQQGKVHRIESRAFMLLTPGLLSTGVDKELPILSFDVAEDAQEISSQRDWWVCEKLLQRKRIVFRVIGNNSVGMGHIYRTLTLAHELVDHEVLFVTDINNSVAVETIQKQGFWVGVYSPSQVTNDILKLQPQLVINDVLDTEKRDVVKLKNAGISVVSFEDLGSGARHTDLTINEIHDKPLFTDSHIFWGHRYFFIRDEFQTARPHRFKASVDCIMLTFGGTDQHDLSSSVYHTIKSFCKEFGIFIHIVTGPGYRRYQRLANDIKGEDGVSLTHASGVISNIMEQAQLAITSNGRTVYEFSHMNIPSIVIAQHEREITHTFATEDNGFLPLGLYKKDQTESVAFSALEKLVGDNEYRHLLFRRMTTFRFGQNKQRVVKKILRILNKPSNNFHVK
jgi:spore coat polysaccharide biosynthesis predicted glycosyltransferase SpsG